MTLWQIHGTNQHIALGELQQDTAVGGELDDGMMSFDDNGQNSEEQSSALQHWIEAFEHEMTQHGDIDAAVAALKAAGCPDPMAVAEMYLHQQENPETTEDLQETPPAEDPMMQPAPQDIAQGGGQPALAKTAQGGPISPDAAHFESLLHGGMSPETIYHAYPNHHPLIDAAVERHQPTQPIVNEQPVQNPGREQLNQDMSNSVQQMREMAEQNRLRGAAFDAEPMGGDVMPDPNRGADMAAEAPAPQLDQMSQEPVPDLESMTQEMRDLGWDADAEAWYEQIVYSHPEDQPAEKEEMFKQLQEMRARAEQEEVGVESPMERAMRDDGSTMVAKSAGLPGDSPRDKKADEIYKAIRRDSDHTKSEAAAIANAQANDLKDKDDLSLGNDEDKEKKKDSDDKPKSDSKDSDSKDEKDDDGKPPWLKKKDARASYQGLNGRIAAIYTNMWGDEMIMLATELGQIEVPSAEVAAPTADEAAGDDPLSEINEFMSIIDPAGNTLEQYAARMENLSQVVAAGRGVISAGKVSIADQVALDEIIVNAAAEIEGLKFLAENYVSPEAEQYVADQAENAYGIGAGGVIPQADLGHQSDGTWLDEVYHDMQSDIEATDFDAVVNEEPMLLVDSLPDSALADAGVTQQMAYSHISLKTGGVPEPTRSEINRTFVAATEQARRVVLAARKGHLAKTAAQLPDADGPAEGLFL